MTEINHSARPLTELSERDTMALINAEQFARMLGISPRTLWRLLSAGKLIRPVRIGGSTRWRLSEVLRWIDEGCQVPALEPRD